MKQKRSGRKPHQFIKKASPRDWQIVVVDQGPIRTKAARECGKMMERLEMARREWRQFDLEDRPAYGRWVSATFGALLTEIREAGERLREVAMLVAEVEDEYFIDSRGGYGSAYKRVMQARERAREYSEAKSRAVPPGQEGGAFRGAGPFHAEEEPFGDDEDFELDDFEVELLFERFCDEVLGIDPDRLSDKEYYRMLKEFKKNVVDKVTGKAKQEREAKSAGSKSVPSKAIPSAAKPEAVRIKETYRVLVRRLHPDLRADGNADVSHFWHEVQEAYAQGNLERLEMLLALTDIQANTTGDHTSVSQMRAVLAELRRSLKALEKSLKDAKKDPAWDFARSKNREAVKARMEREMRSELSQAEAEYAEMRGRVRRWEEAAKPAPKREKKVYTNTKPEPKPASHPKGSARNRRTGFGF